VFAMKKVTWFVGGIAAGAAGAGYAKRKVRETAAQLAPTRVVRSAGEGVRSGVRAAADAVREGRVAMKAKESELRARSEGRAASLDEVLAPGDEVLVDGRPVEPGQVIVLRDLDRSGSRRRRQAR
jgi:hypothetical protein